MEMELNEALRRLERAGLICEGSMSLKDKIANAQKYNKENYKIDNEKFFNDVREYVANELGYKVYADIDNYNEKAQDQTCEYTIKLPKMMEGDATVYVTVSDSERAVLIQLEHPNYDEQTHIRFSDHNNPEELTTDVAEWISDASTNI